MQNKISGLNKSVSTIEKDNKVKTGSEEQKIIVGEGSMITIGPIGNTDLGYVDKTKRY